MTEAAAINAVMRTLADPTRRAVFERVVSCDEITVGDELIFSKKQLGRFPQPGEVERELGSRAGA